MPELFMLVRSSNNCRITCSFFQWLYLPIFIWCQPLLTSISRLRVLCTSWSALHQEFGKQSIVLVIEYWRLKDLWNIQAGLYTLFTWNSSSRSISNSQTSQIKFNFAAVCTSDLSSFSSGWGQVSICKFICISLAFSEPESISNNLWIDAPAFFHAILDWCCAHHDPLIN